MTAPIGSCESRSSMLQSLVMLVALVLASTLLTGCGTLSRWTGSTGGTVTVTSLNEDAVRLSNDCDVSIYTDSITSELSFFASDVDMETLLGDAATPSQVLRIDVLWRPTPGRTPMDTSATNLSIRYVVNAGGEIGLYGGGGFGTISGSPDGPVTINIRDGMVKLLDSTDGFKDLFGATVIEGSFTASMDRAKAMRLHHVLSQRVTNAFGETVIVVPRP